MYARVTVPCVRREQAFRKIQVGATSAEMMHTPTNVREMTAFHTLLTCGSLPIQSVQILMKLLLGTTTQTCAFCDTDVEHIIIDPAAQ